MGSSTALWTVVVLAAFGCGGAGGGEGGAAGSAGTGNAGAAAGTWSGGGSAGSGAGSPSGGGFGGSAASDGTGGSEGGSDACQDECFGNPAWDFVCPPARMHAYFCTPEVTPSSELDCEKPPSTGDAWCCKLPC